MLPFPSCFPEIVNILQILFPALPFHWNCPKIPVTSTFPKPVGVFCPYFGWPLLHPQLLILLPFKVSLPSAPAALLSLDTPLFVSFSVFFTSTSPQPLNFSAPLVTSPVLTSFHWVHFIILETELALFAGNSQINISGPRILRFRGLYLVFNWTTPLDTPQHSKCKRSQTYLLHSLSLYTLAQVKS